MLHHLVDPYQVCSNYAPGSENGPVARVTYLYKINLCRIWFCLNSNKGNGACNNYFRITLDLWGGVTRSFFFLKVVMLQRKLTGMKHRTQRKQLYCPFTHSRPLDGVKAFFCAFQIKWKAVYKLCNLNV